MWALAGFVLTVAAALAVTLVLYLGPAEAPGREVVVLIRPGLTLPAIAADLERQGLVRSAHAFLFLARLHKSLGSARAGEFLLNSGWTPQEILRVLTTTGGLQHRVQVREGLPWWAVAKLFEAEGLASHEGFAQATRNATLLDKYSIPATAAQGAEGFLFPQTYQLPRSFDDSGAVAVETMLREFGRQAKKLWPQGLPPADELRRIVILASLVERETGAPSERARIAGVFVNRLKVGMRLQCDPTTIYGLGESFDGDLKRSHLEDPANPYNTYAHAGLPPGPICSPGLESLRAAQTPEQNEYLFFVAKGDGTHEFSRTLAEHNQAVTRFQRQRNKATYRSTLR